MSYRITETGKCEGINVREPLTPPHAKVRCGYGTNSSAARKHINANSRVTNQASRYMSPVPVIEPGNHIFFSVMGACFWLPWRSEFVQ